MSQLECRVGTGALARHAPRLIPSAPYFPPLPTPCHTLLWHVVAPAGAATVRFLTISGPSVDVLVRGISVVGTLFRPSTSDVKWTMVGGAGVAVNWDAGGGTVPGGTAVFSDVRLIQNIIKLSPSSACRVARNRTPW